MIARGSCELAHLGFLGILLASEQLDGTTCRVCDHRERIAR